MRAPALLMVCALAAFVADASQGRATSDFEIAAMNRQLETSRDAFSRIAAHLNLGDLQAGRGNQAEARSHYETARTLARTETSSARSEAETLLGQIVLSLSDPHFDSLRRKIARDEQFEIFSSTRTDSSAYLSLLNRSRLRLAKIYEESGRAEDARLQYRAVLADRIDDPAALAGMARLASGDERQRYFAESFDASPFSFALVRHYESSLRERPEVSPSTRRGNDATVQGAIEEASRNRHQNALNLLKTLATSHPVNSTLRYLIVRSHIRSAEFAQAREQLERRGLPAGIAEELRKSLALEEEAASRVPSFFNAVRPNEPVKLSPDDLSLLVARIRTGTLTPEQLSLVDSLHFVAPVAFEDVTSRDAETTTFQAGSLAVADPSSRRVWMSEKSQSGAAAFGRGFLRGLIGLGLYAPRSSEYPTGVDRVWAEKWGTAAYDSSSGTLYLVSKGKATKVASGVPAGAIALTGRGVTWWNTAANRLEVAEIRR